MPELKLCPFCGSKDIGIDCNFPFYDEPQGIPVVYWVYCRTCKAFGGDGKTETAAITAWNKRLKEDEHEGRT